VLAQSRRRPRTRRDSRPSHLGGSGSHGTRRRRVKSRSADAKEPAGGERTRPVFVGKREVSRREMSQNQAIFNAYDGPFAGVKASIEGRSPAKMHLMYVYVYPTPSEYAHLLRSSAPFDAHDAHSVCPPQAPTFWEGPSATPLFRARDDDEEVPERIAHFIERLISSTLAQPTRSNRA